MGRSKAKIDPRPTKQTKKDEDERSRRAPRSAVILRTDATVSTEGRRGQSAGRPANQNMQTPPSTILGVGSFIFGRSTRKQTTLPFQHHEQQGSAHVPAESSQLSEPRVNKDRTPQTPLTCSLDSPMRNINEVILDAAPTTTGGSVEREGAPRVDNIRNIIDLPLAKPAKVTLMSPQEWSSYSEVRPFDATKKILEFLVTEVPTAG